MLFAALVCGVLAMMDFAAHASAPASGIATQPGAPASATLIQQGRTLFVSDCASCHGMDARGIPGRGPSLHGVGALAADFYLETGRMPLPSPREQPQRTRPAYPQRQISALVAFVASFGGPPIPTVSLRHGSLAQGEQLFALSCAGCHTIQAQGGVVTGATVPPLTDATATQVAEAIRIGPYVMPRFSSSEISNSDINSIARYVASTQRPDDRGGWGIGRVGPIPEGMVAWLLAVAALLLIARLLGERISDRPVRANAAPEAEDA